MANLESNIKSFF